LIILFNPQYWLSSNNFISVVNWMWFSLFILVKFYVIVNIYHIQHSIWTPLSCLHININTRKMKTLTKWVSDDLFHFVFLNFNSFFINFLQSFQKFFETVFVAGSFQFGFSNHWGLIMTKPSFIIKCPHPSALTCTRTQCTQMVYCLSSTEFSLGVGIHHILSVHKLSAFKWVHSKGVLSVKYSGYFGVGIPQL